MNLCRYDDLPLNIGFLTITSADQDEIQHRGD
jgi:hypothetical protein